MPYQFAIQDQDYTDFASGSVLYNLPGAPAFPIRLASEIFQRARGHMQQRRRLTLYDPTCGGAYHLTALGFLYGEQIGAILASDVDENILDLARRNLGLLSEEGIRRREREIQEMLERYGKESHAAALHSAAALHHALAKFPPITARAFLANATDRAAIQQGLAGEPVDLVFSDIPYGQLTKWRLSGSVRDDNSSSPLWHMLDSLRPILSGEALVTIAADKSQKIAHEGYRRVERFQIGKRQVALLRPE